jgi:hypothetical protein
MTQNHNGLILLCLFLALLCAIALAFVASPQELEWRIYGVDMGSGEPFYVEVF